MIHIVPADTYGYGEVIKMAGRCIGSDQKLRKVTKD
jgi:hypothetical protein